MLWMQQNNMLQFLVLLCCVVGGTLSSDVQVEPGSNITDDQVVIVQKKVSDQILAILEHYKQDDPVGLPGSPVPDPMPIPDMKQSVSVATINFKSSNVEGLSKFRIEYVKSNVADMEVAIGLTIEQLIVRGKYVMSSFFTRSSGNYNVTLSNVTVSGVATLEVNRQGQLEAQDINMNIVFQNINVVFENPGFLGSLLQSVINQVGAFLFENIKPHILNQVNTNARGNINKHIMEIPQRFPNSIPPLDMAVAEMRKVVRDMGYDPYKIPDYNHTSGVLTMYLRNTWVTGLASFYRVGNVTVNMKNNTVHVGLNVGSQRVRGSCFWEVELAGYLSKAGFTSFTVEYVQVDVTVAQTLDVRNRPKLEYLDLIVGNIQVRVDGAGTMDYIIELVVNVLPNVLRYQIVDALENPIKQRIQAMLDEIDVEKLVQDNLNMVDDLNIAN